jgi:hypothetical protein
MRSIRRTAAAAALALGTALATSATPASAATTSVNFASDASTTRRKLGAYHGTATYDGNAGTLTVTITNDAAGGRGFLTGLAFKARDSASGHYMDLDDVVTRGDDDAFDDLGRGRSRKLKPFKLYDTGAAINGKWNGGGSRKGIAAGQSRTFIFGVSGADQDMSAMDLLTNADGPSIVAAFGGFRGGRKDQVGGVLSLADISSTQNIPLSNGDGLQAVPTTVFNPNPPPQNGGGGPVTAVPLPAGVWGGLATLALLAASLRTRLRRAFA